MSMDNGIVDQVCVGGQTIQVEQIQEEAFGVIRVTSGDVEIL